MKVFGRLVVGASLILSSSCGRSAPTSPTAAAPVTPPVIVAVPPPAAPTLTAPNVPVVSVNTQRALLGGSEFRLIWSASGTSHRLLIGRSPGASDLLDTRLGLPTYVWLAPSAGTFFARVSSSNEVGESPASADFRLVSVDLRDVIDAMLYASGPLTDGVQSGPSISPNVTVCGFPDGHRVSLLFADDISEANVAKAQEFGRQYSANTGNTITIKSDRAGSNLTSWTILDVPPETIAIRQMTTDEMRQGGVCGPSLGCNTGGPRCPSSNFRSRGLTTIRSPDGGLAIAHEVAHAYGLFHLNYPAGTYLSTPLMKGSRDQSSGVDLQQNLTETEAAALDALHKAGVRTNARRGDLISRGLVNP